MTNLQADSMNGALISLRNRSSSILDANALFPAQISPNLTGIPFLPYRITPGYRNWCGITVIPIFNQTPTAGDLGIELVSPERKILHNVTIPIAQVESYKPAFFPFPVIRDSQTGIYELRIFVKNALTPVWVMESRFLSPAEGLRPLRARPLVKLTFNDLGAGEGENQYASTPGSQNELTYDLMKSVGSSSLEDHYWCSGWQTANVQLITDLQPNDSIIDIGCGVGRLASGFHGWYGGRYVGTDIILSSINYCKKAFPRFEFYHMDVISPYYNSNGKIQPNDMVIPTESNAFDVAVLYSVYTHLLPQTLLRMTTEVSRVLRSKGRCLATFFVLDGKTDHAIFSFSHALSDYCSVQSEDSPESAVGYTKDFICETFVKQGLRVKTHYPGTWSGQPGLTVQDQILFIKD